MVDDVEQQARCERILTIRMTHVVFLPDVPRGYRSISVLLELHYSPDTAQTQCENLNKVSCWLVETKMGPKYSEYSLFQVDNW